MTDATPQQRHAEFRELFDKMPGRNKTQRLEHVVKVTGLKPGTVRQYRMESPPSYPSEQVLRLMRQFVGA